MKSIKLFIILALFNCFNQSLLAKVSYERTILTCLGQEELKLHKLKMLGPIYKLNQIFISELSSFNKINFKAGVLERICKYRPFYPSVNLLKGLLIQREQLFDFTKDDTEKASNNYKVKYLKDFVKRMPHVLFRYLSLLQSIVPTYDCLYQKIPNFKFFLTQYMYLEQDYPMEQLIEDKNKIVQLFKGLEGFDLILAECSLIKKKRLKKENQSKIEKADQKKKG